MRSEWQPWKLGEAGAEIRRRNSEFVTLIDETVTQIRAAGAHWSGDAYYAAYDRIAGDRDAANKVALDTDDLAQTLIDSGTSLAGFRQALLDKVDEAVAAGFTVSEDWQVTPGPDVSDDDGDTQYTHQTAITTALNELLGTQSDIATKIEQARANVRTRSDQLGEGDPLDGTPQTDPMLAVYSPQSDTGDTEQDPTDPSTTPAGTPQASPIAEEQPTGEDETDKSKSGEDETGDQTGDSGDKTGDGGDKAGDKSGDKTDESGKKTDDSGDGKDESKSSGSTGPASDPNSWTPSDVTNLITAVGGITGDMPTLIESVGKLDDDLDDIIKAGGDAGKNLIDSAGTAAEKFANAADTVITSVDQAADGTAADSPSTGEPAKDSTSAPDKASTDSPTGQPSEADPNAKATDQKADDSASKTDDSKTGDPDSDKAAESKTEQPASVRQASYTGTEPTASSNPSTPSAPSTAPASTGLLGAHTANRQSDSEHTRRVEATPSPLFETPPQNE
ncbi:hypothetical protein [Nocardia sputorum]|uniref:hypothetical protein n=1 Tax=Nocardia sputorum TaxID=2984338 RepID=UPI00249287E5|nr:hypothetical protein [Nocardia sputorum]